MSMTDSEKWAWWTLAVAALTAAAYFAFVARFGSQREIAVFSKGWDASIILPVWRLEEFIRWCATLLLAVEAATTLVLYRRGAHA
jgi:hypothetical protein